MVVRGERAVEDAVRRYVSSLSDWGRGRSESGVVGGRWRVRGARGDGRRRKIV